MPGVDILEPQSLSRLYVKYDEATRTTLAPFFSTKGNDNEGVSVAYDVLEMGRGAAKINTRDGDPNQVKSPKRATVSQKGISISEEIMIPPSTLKDLRAPGEMQVANGEDWIGRNIRQLRGFLETRLEILRAQCLGSNSANPGYLQFREPGLSADTTVDLGYAAGHMAIGSAWQTYTTDIIADIMAAKLQNVQDSGRLSDTMWTTSTVMGYIIANEAIGAFLSDGAKDEIRTTGRLKSLCELDIVLVDTQYENDSGTMVGYIGDEFVAIGPKDAMYREIIECAPVSPHAPAGMKGLFMRTRYEDKLKANAHIEYEWTGLPSVVVPDEITFDNDVTA